MHYEQKYILLNCLSPSSIQLFKLLLTKPLASLHFHSDAHLSMACYDKTRYAFSRATVTPSRIRKKSTKKAHPKICRDTFKPKLTCVYKCYTGFFSFYLAAFTIIIMVCSHGCRRTNKYTCKHTVFSGKSKHNCD